MRYFKGDKICFDYGFSRDLGEITHTDGSKYFRVHIIDSEFESRIGKEFTLSRPYMVRSVRIIERGYLYSSRGLITRIRDRFKLLFN